jgi:hypothetical protein
MKDGLINFLISLLILAFFLDHDGPSPSARHTSSHLCHDPPPPTLAFRYPIRHHLHLFHTASPSRLATTIPVGHTQYKYNGYLTYDDVR